MWAQTTYKDIIIYLEFSAFCGNFVAAYVDNKTFKSLNGAKCYITWKLKKENGR